MGESIPIDLRELLIKGEFISMIPEGSKLNMSNLSFSSADSWMGSFYRTLHGENRREMLQTINDIVDRFIMKIKDYRETSFLPMIIRTLTKMKKQGITNLMRTYSNSPDVIAGLTVCCENIDLQLRPFKEISE